MYIHSTIYAQSEKMILSCRDISTLNLLRELDIDAYYSGDLTITLNGRNNKKYIVVNFNDSENILTTDYKINYFRKV